MSREDRQVAQWLPSVALLGVGWDPHLPAPSSVFRTWLAPLGGARVFPVFWVKGFPKKNRPGKENKSDALFFPMVLLGIVNEEFQDCWPIHWIGSEPHGSLASTRERRARPCLRSLFCQSMLPGFKHEPPQQGVMSTQPSRVFQGPNCVKSCSPGVGLDPLRAKNRSAQKLQFGQ